MEVEMIWKYRRQGSIDEMEVMMIWKE